MIQIYITDKTSETGKAIDSILTRAAHFSEIAQNFKAQYGIQSLHHFTNQLCGAVCAKFSSPPDPKLWVRFGTDGYRPRPSKNDLNKDWLMLQELTILRSEIDEAIGGGFFTNCELEITPDYFLFLVDQCWNYLIPSDCTHIDEATYYSLSKTRL